MAAAWRLEFTNNDYGTSQMWVAWQGNLCKHQDPSKGKAQDSDQHLDPTKGKVQDPDQHPDPTIGIVQGPDPSKDKVRVHDPESHPDSSTVQAKYRFGSATLQEGFVYGVWCKLYML